MHIFASWSGEDSRQIAELLKSWIPCVLQDVDVYVSSRDIGKGERWASSVTAHLSEIDFGIVVVTKNNMNAPWILFEAGALSKSVKSRVIPLLCGVHRIDTANSPLTQFQYAIVEKKEEIKAVIEQVNSAMVKPLDQKRLDNAFDKWWPDFQNEYSRIELISTRDGKKVTESDRLDKIEAAIEELLISSRRSSRYETVNTGVPAWATTEIASLFNDSKRKSDWIKYLIKSNPADIVLARKEKPEDEPDVSS
ncbi:TIR domain-containing protein [Brucella sp. IR073]|uniref:TIR domain-containing protein n=1 Tax=unclassified Brucella TaxID=2632610 RepID=UPI003B97DF41